MPRSKTGKTIMAVRGPVHGNFAEGAAVTQGIMAILSATSQWPRLSAARHEALHMIIHKVHRIVTGNPDHADHWDDIGGYAELGKLDGQRRAARAIVKLHKDRTAKIQKQRVERPAKKIVKAKKPKKAKKKVARSPARRGVSPRVVAARVAPKARRPRAALVAAPLASAGE